MNSANTIRERGSW